MHDNDTVVEVDVDGNCSLNLRLPLLLACLLIFMYHPFFKLDAKIFDWE